MNKTENDSSKILSSNLSESQSQIIQQNQNTTSIDSNSLNQLLSVIYDDEFVIMINDLSHSIKIYNKAMVQFINLTKGIITNNYSFFENLKTEKDNEIKTLPNLFGLIETNYNNFFSTAKIIFKKMKKYRNERLENINKLPLAEKNLKYCLINFKKDKTQKENNINNENNSDNNIYIPSPVPNRNYKENIIYEENAELKKKLFNLEKKIEIIGNNKKNIITNNINNISNFHLQENKQNESELIRENKNIIQNINDLINIIEYEYSPDYSFSKNTFDNIDEIVEHKKEIKQQKEELINSLKKYLSNIENNKITENEEINNNNTNINFLKKIDEMQQIIEKLESKIKQISAENKDYIEENKALKEENSELKEENTKKQNEIDQNEIAVYNKKINELENKLIEKQNLINNRIKKGNRKYKYRKNKF